MTGPRKQTRKNTINFYSDGSYRSTLKCVICLVLKQHLTLHSQEMPCLKGQPQNLCNKMTAALLFLHVYIKLLCI